MTPTLLPILSALILSLAAYAMAFGGLGLVSPKLAARFGVAFNGKVSYLGLLTLGTFGLLPLSMLIDADTTLLAIGTAGFALLGALLWKFLGFGPGWFFELALLARRPARDFWKIERYGTGRGRTRTRKRWVTRDQGEVEQAIKVGGFWAVFCTAIDVLFSRRVLGFESDSGEFLFGVICAFLLFFFLFAGGAVQQPATAPEEP